MDGSRGWIWIVGAVVAVGAGLVLWRMRSLGGATREREEARGGPEATAGAREGSGGTWDFYFARVDDEPASIFVNLERRASAPDPARPTLLWVHLKMRAPRPDGLSSREEAEDLWKVEDALEEAAKAGSGAELVGRITSAGYRQLYFYAPSADGFEDAVRGALRSFAGYEAETGSKPDPDWSQYLDVLYPKPADYQRIQNRKVRDALEKEGDDPSVRRTVAHWAYFGTPEARDAFARRAIAEGYREPAGTRSELESKGRLGIRLERERTLHDVDADTVQLDEWARELGGEYDGWETSVEKPR